MAGNRKFYWLKLMHDFFMQPKIKKLRRIAGGDTYTIIYLKLQLLSLKNDGVLVYEGIEESMAEELALTIDEDTDNVQVTLNYLFKHNMIEELDAAHILMTETQSMIGSETAAASRVRKHRALKEKKESLTITEAKTNAQRQKMHRAKKACEEKQHIPFIEDHMNNKRYGGNYYIVMKRDKFKCAICGSIENLCVHHIDGYSEEKPENNHENKLITVCRCCHSNIHAGQEINHDLLESIDYFYKNSNEMLPCNASVTNCNTEKEIEKEIEKELEIEKEYIPAEAGDSFPAKTPDQLLTEEFNQIWDLYPNKKGRTKAFKKYKEYRTSTGSDYCTFDEVLTGLEKYLLYIEQNDIRVQFIKHGDTWFNNQCWLDDYTIEEPDPFIQSLEFKQAEMTEEEIKELEEKIKNFK